MATARGARSSPAGSRIRRTRPLRGPPSIASGRCLFGKPLVAPIDDIPLAGPYPPGLELLADDFVEHGYDLQRLIRLIAASDVFQRDSRAEFEITDAARKSLGRISAVAAAAGADFRLADSSRVAENDRRPGPCASCGSPCMARRTSSSERYGDLGEDEFTDRGSTIPQRLLMMNGNLVKDRTQPNPLVSASTRIAMLDRPAGQAGRSRLPCRFSRAGPRPTNHSTSSPD